MSGMKEYLMDLCEERDKVLSTIGDGECDSYSELFFGYGSLTPPSAEFAKYFPHCGDYILLIIQLDNVMTVARHNGDHNFKRIVWSMAYSHAVTLLEAFISQSLVALAKQYNIFVTRITQHYDPITTIKKEGWRKVLESPGGIPGLVIDGLANDVFHNLKTVKNLFGLMFDDAGKGIDISPLEPVINRRHDIVHRNGASMTGEIVNIEFSQLDQDVALIKAFANDLKERMTAGVVAATFRG